MEKRLRLLGLFLFFICTYTFGQSSFVDNQIIIKFKTGASPADLTGFLGQIDAVEKDAISDKNIYYYDIGSFPMSIVDWASGPVTFDNAIDLLDHTLQKAEVDGGALNYEVVLPDFDPSSLDPVTNGLLSLADCQNYPGLFPADVGGTEEVSIALIDTGVSEDALSAYFGEWISDVVDLTTSGNGKGADENGHGTRVASIIADILDYMNVPNASITSIKAFDQDGKSDLYTLISALNEVEQRDIDIVNMSFGFTPDPNDTYSSLFVNELMKLDDKGTLMVASAGNSSLDLSQISYYPATAPGIENLLTVGSVECTLAYAGFSNYGSEIVDIAAPGKKLVAVDLDQTLTYCSGTSYSSPFVAGLAAVYGSQLGQFDAAKVKCMLLSSALMDFDLVPKVKKGLYLNYDADVTGLDCSTSYPGGNSIIQSGNNSNTTKAEAYTIQPNPFTGNNLSITIDVDIDVTAQIALYNLSGQELWSTNQNLMTGHNNISLDIPSINSWSAGIYIAKVKMGNQVLPYKLVKR